MTSITNELNKNKDWIVIDLNSTQNLINDCAMRLIDSCKKFVRKDYPVFLLMTGLYENIYAIQNDPALAFLLRTPKISLEPLSLHQITKQYSDIFRIDDVDMLDDFVYKKIWSSLSKQDKDVVLAIKR